MKNLFDILIDKDKQFNNEKLFEFIEFIKNSGKADIIKNVLKNVKEEYFINDKIHGISHNERVVILVVYIGLKEGLSDNELKLLANAALYHDIGRKNNAKNKNHGEISAELIEENKGEIFPDLNDEEINIIKALSISHSNDDEKMEEIAEKHDIKNKMTFLKIAKILKDADALDRVRLSRFGKLDINYLRTDIAKQIIEIAQELYFEDINMYNMQKNDKVDIRFEDDKYIYAFRALSKDDIEDIKNGIKKIRTDRERFENERGVAKYSQSSEISLEEVWDHIRIRHIKETNCISLSTNANVSIDYGQAYSGQYVMVKIPKTEESKVYNAGQYMLGEIDRIVQEELSKIPEDSEIWDIIRKIDDEESAKNVRGIVADAYDRVKSSEGRYVGKKNQLKSKTAIVSRLDRRQYFTEEQQLEYNKIIAKLTVLETRGYLRSIIPTKADNSSLIGTIGIAFSSGELIHYKDIEANDIVQVPKEMMDILSFIQQVRDKGINNEAIKQLEIKVLGLIKQRI